MKIYTLGNGFVANHLSYTKILDRLSADQKRIHYILKKYKPDVIVNCIGYCGIKNIDDCEIEKEETVIANTIIPTLLAIECEKLGIRLVHIGSGCIYSGESNNFHYVQGDGSPMPDTIKTYSLGDPNYEPFWGKAFAHAMSMVLPSKKIEDGWKEVDPANPQSYYSNTKAATDLVISSMPCSTILRIRMPISDQDTPRNLINKLRNYKQVINIPNSVTFMDDLVRCIDWVIYHNLHGIYHVTNPQPLTAARIMNEFKKYVPEHDFDYITEQQLDQLTTAKRSNCILNSDKLTLTGFQMTNSDEALDNCMKNYIKNLRK